MIVSCDRDYAGFHDNFPDSRLKRQVRQIHQLDFAKERTEIHAAGIFDLQTVAAKTDGLRISDNTSVNDDRKFDDSQVHVAAKLNFIF